MLQLPRFFIFHHDLGTSHPRLIFLRRFVWPALGLESFYFRFLLGRSLDPPCFCFIRLLQHELVSRVFTLLWYIDSFPVLSFSYMKLSRTPIGGCRMVIEAWEIVILWTTIRTGSRPTLLPAWVLRFY